MSANRIPACLAVIASLSLFAPAAFAQADKKDTKKDEPKKKDGPPPPAATTSATSIFPPGGQAGKTVSVVVEGAGLVGATMLWFEHPGITAKITAAAEGEVKADVTIAANVPPDLYAWRIAAPRGVSAVRRFGVSAGNEINETEPNDEVEKAQTVAAGTTVNGRLDKYDDMDCFKVTGAAGGRVVAVCRSRTLGAAAEPALALVDAKGRLIATPRQSDFIDGDPVLDATLPEAGTYVVQVWNLVRGDDRSRVYRLTFSSAPVARYAYPAGAQRGKPASITLGVRDPGGKLGGRLPGTPFTEMALKVAVPADHAAGEFGVRPPGGDPIVIAVGDLPEVLEAEPNDEPAKANEVPIGSVVNGRLGARGDFDHFRFPARKGRTVVLEIASAKLGYPGDLTVAVLDAKGTQLAANDDASATDIDPRLTFTPPEDGTFIARVGEAVPERVTGPEYVYRLTIREPRPDFALTAANPIVSVGAGSTAAITIQAVRIDGHGDPIALTLSGLPGEYKAAPATIGAGGASGVISFPVPENAAGRNFPVQIVGESAVDGKPARRAAIATVTLVTLEGKAANTLRTPTVFVSVGSPPPIVVSATPEKVDSAPGGAFTLKVNVKRTAAATGAIDLAVTSGPEGAAATKGQIAAGANSADLAFKLTPKAAAGVLVISASTKVGADTVTVPLPPVTVNIASFTASLPTPKVSAVRGTTVQVPVAIVRQGGFNAPVTLTVTGLPKDFKSDAATIPADKNQGTVSISVPTTAVVGPVPKLAVAANATVGGAPLTASAGALNLTVADLPFSVTAANPKVEAKPGTTVDIPVKVARTAPFADAVTITVTAETLPKGYQAAPVTIPADKADGVLKVVVPKEAKPGDANKLALEVAGKVSGAALKAPAGTVRITVAAP
jgi:hypothetical protein